MVGIRTVGTGTYAEQQIFQVKTDQLKKKIFVSGKYGTVPAVQSQTPADLKKGNTLCVSVPDMLLYVAP